MTVATLKAVTPHHIRILRAAEKPVHPYHFTTGVAAASQLSPHITHQYIRDMVRCRLLREVGQEVQATQAGRDLVRAHDERTAIAHPYCAATTCGLYTGNRWPSRADNTKHIRSVGVAC